METTKKSFNRSKNYFFRHHVSRDNFSPATRCAYLKRTKIKFSSRKLISKVRTDGWGSPPFHTIILGWEQFWEPKTSIGDNFTPKWSWGLIFSGSVVLMSTTIYYNMKVELPLVAEIENDLFFPAKLIL